MSPKFFARGAALALILVLAGCRSVAPHGITQVATIDALMAGDIDMIINTPHGVGQSRVDGYEIRSVAVLRGIPCITTVQGLAAAVEGIEAIQRGGMGVRSLQGHAIDLERLREAERLG